MKHASMTLEEFLALVEGVALRLMEEKLHGKSTV